MGVFRTLLSTDDEVEETDLSERVDRVELERWIRPPGRSNFCVSSASMLSSDKGCIADWGVGPAMSR